MTTFLHASDAELDIGTILRSDLERYARRWWRPGRATDVFRRMEELRPPSCRSHGDAVFMMASMDDLTGQAFGYRRYIYEITPVLLPGEQVERYDLGWIDGTTADGSTPLSRDESCRNYWSGRPCPENAHPCWEYLAPAARVVRLHAQCRQLRHVLMPRSLDAA